MSGAAKGSFVNPLPPLEVLSAEQVEAIHRASLRILRDIGIEVLSDRAFDLYARAGAVADRATRRVRFDPALIEETVALAPAEFTLRARNPERSVTVGGHHLVFTSVGGPAYVSDLGRGRRPGCYADMCDYIRVVQCLDIVHQEGGGPTEPTDLPPETRHLDYYLAAITLTDKTWQCWALGGDRVEDAIEMTALALGTDRDGLLRQPAQMTVVNTNSPLRLDIPMGEGLIALASAGQATMVTPFTLSGAMAPVTLAGALALQNAEALAVAALTQMVRPGAPVAYGGFTSNVDMKSGSPAFGTPEYAKATLAGGQLARRYGLPYRSSNVNASNAVDAQGGYESAMASWAALMGGTNVLEHGAGWLEGGLTASFEKLIVDAEMLAAFAAFLTGRPAPVPRLLPPLDPPVDAAGRAEQVWRGLLAGYEPPALDPAIRDALDDYVERRKRRAA
ncbi:MAG: methyltransferase [Alphaproteobacteria bacterium]|nr:MAG: methyltransferase [Alphaproteobacteria bacterium]